MYIQSLQKEVEAFNDLINIKAQLPKIEGIDGKSEIVHPEDEG